MKENSCIVDIKDKDVKNKIAFERIQKDIKIKNLVKSSEINTRFKKLEDKVL